jgi:predicted nuclease of restriction endonuclease-like RecB superfamily
MECIPKEVKMSNRVTITFDSNPRVYGKTMAKAMEALEKIKKADIEAGVVKINDIQIKIEKLSGGKC